MQSQERENGADYQTPDRLARSKQIVDLLFNFRVAEDKKELVLNAIGTVYADFVVLDEQQKLMRRLARGITSLEVSNAIEDAKRAALLRTQDGTMPAETLEEHRLLVLGGLQQLLQTTRVIEDVGQTNSGIVLIQVGINSNDVENTIDHVQEAAEVSRKMLTGVVLEEVEADIIEPERDILDVPPLQVELEPQENIVDRPPVPRPRTLLDLQYEEAMRRAGLRPSSPNHRQPIQPSRPRVGRDLRRLIIKGGLATVAMVVPSVPITLWARENVTFGKTDAIRNQQKFIQDNPLTEEPFEGTHGGNWSGSYPTLKEGDKFEDIFDGQFRQVIGSTTDIPIYTRQGDTPILMENTWLHAGLADREDQPPLPTLYIERGLSALSGKHYVLVGRKDGNSTEQKYPNIVKLFNTISNQTFYLSITPIQEKAYGSGWQNEIRYMRLISAK